MMYVPVQARRGSYIPSGEDAQQLQNHFHMVNGRRGSTRELGQCPDIQLNLDNEPGHHPLQRRRSLPKTPKKHQNSGHNGHNGHQANQTQHNQNQSSYNQQYSYDSEFESPTPSMVWDEKQQAYIPKYKTKKNHFEDQFDQYLYQSRHISTPVIKTHEAPELVLEVPSDSDSSRRPSGVSICPSDRTGHSQSPRVSQARIEIEGLVIPGAVRIQRRASHCGELQSPGSNTPLLPSLLKVPRTRSRGSSLPDNIGTEQLYRLRNFSTSGKKVINRGDSFRSRSRTSVNSLGSSIDIEQHSCHGTESPSSRSRNSSRSESRKSSRKSSRVTSMLSRKSSNSPKLQSNAVESTANIYRVLMLGAAGVGKTSLCAQFLSSDHINTYDRAAVEAEDCVEKEVSVAVNDKESRVVFIDHQHGDMSLENSMSTYEPSAYLVVAAVDDKASFDQAERILSYLRMSGVLETKAVVLVANKTDLVRKRIVKTAAGKAVAVRFGIKYIETSPGINHNIDELLVGVLTQITLRVKASGKKKSTNKVADFLNRILNISTDSSTQCSNLNIL